MTQVTRKKRKRKIRLEDLPLSPISNSLKAPLISNSLKAPLISNSLKASLIKESLLLDISKTLAKKIDKEVFDKKYVGVKNVLIIAGTGAFLAASLMAPGLPLALKPFLKNKNEYEAWKRFNIPFLKRTLQRLEKQKLVEIDEENGIQVVKITNSGRRRILKYAIDDLTIDKPKFWDGKWRLVSYDIPESFRLLRKIFREYLQVWGFYTLHESVMLHAYPCEKQIEFLREYLGVGKFVRIFEVNKIENDKPFREFFEV